MIWDKIAPFYDFFEKVYNGKCYRGIAEEIKKYITANDIALECACGTGLLTVPMAQKCKKLIATDLSRGMLRRTMKKVMPYKNITVQSASITELPFEENIFDVVVAANVIHLVDEPEKAISEMKRVCKPGGRLIIPNYINNEKRNAVVAARIVAALGVSFKRQFSLSSYKKFLASLRLVNIEYSVIDGRMPCVFAIIENC